MPGAQVANDAELEEFARNKGGTVFHPAGTCRDASAMPTMVSTNTNAAAIMIGEKGAALVQAG